MTNPTPPFTYFYRGVDLLESQNKSVTKIVDGSTWIVNTVVGWNFYEVKTSTRSSLMCVRNGEGVRNEDGSAPDQGTPLRTDSDGSADEVLQKSRARSRIQDT